MWQRRYVGVIAFSLMAAANSFAQEPSVISPEELEAAKAIERNTYHNEECGFSITKPEEWVFYTQEEIESGKSSGVGISFTTTAYLKKQGLAGMARFPLGATWVVLSPSVKSV
jgi:hypothetical protein